MRFKGLLTPLLLVTLFIFQSATAQRSLARYKWEAVLGVGGGNCMCDLGGANQIGTHFLKDFDVVSSRLALSLGIRYKINPFLFTKTDLFYVGLNGDDKLTKEPFRLHRNLNFKTPVIGGEFHLEAHFIKEQQGRRYYIKNARGLKNFYMQSYVFLGIGAFYYNPQGKVLSNGNVFWVPLRKLGTEGQGFEGQPGFYKPFAFSFPIGIGGKVAIDKRWSVGIEYGMRYTTTDYIDDVSTVYYDNDQIRDNRGVTAAYLADPSEGDVGPGGIPNTKAGDQRGDPRHKDAYMVMNITLSYKITPRRRTGKAKF